MSEPHRDEVADVFASALELPAVDRAGFLLAACGDDASLCEEVRSLLRSHERAGAFLQRPALEAAGSDDALGPGSGTPADGVRFGAYLALRKIGAGGMGEVYLAARDDEEFELRVAIKRLGIGMESEEAVQRFREERQTLASLDHPYIARLLDGGTDARGLPYLVMELIDGRPIDRFCEEEFLTLAARLELLAKVCDAVDYAHKNLVVHRDIKPENVLVAAGVGEPTPKLVDFGVAGLLARTDERVRAAGGEEPWMTLEYASPEQVALRPVTTASDVYSLGVLLYLLVVGRSPYRADPADPVALRRAVARGAVTPPREHRPLPSDLEAVILRALELCPDRRYPSPATLAEDVRRFNACLPVQAFPQTLRYRLRKLARRRPGLAAACGLAVALAGVSLGALVRESRAAEANAELSARINRYLVDALSSVDPSNPEGSVDFPAMLEDARRELDSSPGEDDRVRAALLDTFGITYLHLGRREAARADIERALALRVAALGEDHPDVAESLQHLGELELEAGDLAAAAASHRRALEIRRRAFGDEHAEIARSLSDLGLVAWERGDHALAAEYHESALVMRRALLGERDADTAWSWNNLGLVYVSQERYDEARDALRLALSVHRLIGTGRNDGAAVALTNLGYLDERLGDLQEAAARYREGLEIRREVFPRGHPDVAHSLQRLGEVLMFAGDLDEAEMCIRDAVAAWTELGLDDYRAVSTRASLAALLYTRGDHGEAVATYLDLLPRYDERGEASRAELATILNNLGNALCGLGRPLDALPHYRRAIALRSELYGPRHLQVAGTESNLGRALFVLGRLDEAEPLARDALCVRREMLPEPSWQLVDSLSNLGEILLERGDAEGAEPLLREAVEAARAALGPEHWMSANARSVLGACVLRQGRLEEAERWVRGAEDVLRAARGPTHDRTLRAAAREAELDAALAERDTDEVIGP